MGGLGMRMRGICRTEHIWGEERILPESRRHDLVVLCLLQGYRYMLLMKDLEQHVQMKRVMKTGSCKVIQGLKLNKCVVPV